MNDVPSGWLAPLRARLAPRRAMMLAFFASGMNQVFGSFTNLLLNVYLVRHMLPHDFGLYNIAFAITISVGAIANGVFLLPMTVDMPHDDPRARDRFMLDVIGSVVVTAVHLGAIAIAIATCGQALELVGIDAVAFVSATALSCAAYLFKECMTQAGFNQGRERVAVWINVASAAATGTFVTAAVLFNLHLEASHAISIYAVGQAVGMIVGYRLIFRGVAPPSPARAWSGTGHLLRRGLWSAASSLLAILRTQAHTIVVTVLLGPVGVAQINAARLMFAPIPMIQPALVRAAMPRLVKQLRRDVSAFRKSALLLTLGLGAMSAIFGAALLTIGPWAFRYVVSGDYNYSAALFGAWALVFTLAAVRGGLELELQALARFVVLTRIGLITMITTLVAVLALTYMLGAAGALFGLAIGELVTCFLLFRTAQGEPATSTVQSGL